MSGRGGTAGLPGVFRLKISANGRLTVKRGRRIVLDARREDIERIQVIADYPYLRWSFWGRFFKTEPRLTFVLVALADYEVTLRLSDAGFNSALQWLASGGWNMAAAEKAAVLTPLVRVEVERTF